MLLRGAYLDTSTVNRLLEPSHDDLRAWILSAHGPLPILSAWTIAEIVETPDPGHRQRLLRFCDLLRQRGKVFGHPGEVLHLSLARVVGLPDAANVWFGPQAQAAENLLSRHKEVNEEDRLIAASENRTYRDAFESVVLGIEGQLQGIAVPQQSLGEWVGELLGNQANLHRDVISHGVPATHAQVAAAGVTEFAPDLLALRAAMLSTWVAVYNRCLGPVPRSKESGEGRDLIHGIYLAGCETFVTADRGQALLLRGIAEHIRPRPQVLMLDDLDGLRRGR